LFGDFLPELIYRKVLLSAPVRSEPTIDLQPPWALTDNGIAPSIAPQLIDSNAIVAPVPTE
jgi:hypothetical protein